MEVAIVDHAFQLELFRLVKFWLIISIIFISIFSQINFLNTIHISIDLFFQAKITPLCKITPPQKKNYDTKYVCSPFALIQYQLHYVVLLQSRNEKMREREINWAHVGDK